MHELLLLCYLATSYSIFFVSANERKIFVRAKKDWVRGKQFSENCKFANDKCIINSFGHGGIFCGNTVNILIDQCIRDFIMDNTLLSLNIMIWYKYGNILGNFWHLEFFEQIRRIFCMYCIIYNQIEWFWATL